MQCFGYAALRRLRPRWVSANFAPRTSASATAATAAARAACTAGQVRRSHRRSNGTTGLACMPCSSDLSGRLRNLQ